MKDRLKQVLEHPYAAVAFALAAMAVSLTVAFTVIRTQTRLNDRADAAATINCQRVLALRDAAIDVLELASAYARSDREIDNDTRRAQIRFYAVAEKRLERVRCP